MNNVINLNERKITKSEESKKVLDELQKNLENIDAEAVYRAMNSEVNAEPNIDNTLLRRHDRQKMTECFEAFASASAMISKSNADWGK